MPYYFERKNDIYDVVDLEERDKGGEVVIMPRLGEREWMAWRTDRRSVLPFLSDKSMEGHFILFSRTVNGISFTGALCGSAVQAYACQQSGGSLIGREGIYSVYSLRDDMQVKAVLGIEGKLKKFRHSRTALLMKKKGLYGMFVSGVNAPHPFRYHRQYSLYIAPAGEVDEVELDSFMVFSDIRPRQKYLPFSVADGTERILQKPGLYILELAAG